MIESVVEFLDSQSAVALIVTILLCLVLLVGSMTLDTAPDLSESEDWQDGLS